MRYYYKCLDYDDKIRFIVEMGRKGYTFLGKDYTSYMKYTRGPDTFKWPVASIDDINKNVSFGKNIPPNRPEYQSNGKKVYNMDRFRFI
jgi:hypothetical protein